MQDLSFKDIYYRVDEKIVANGFWEKDFTSKKELVIEELYNYLIVKLAENNINLDIKEKNIIALLKELEELIALEDRDEILNPFVFYLIKVAGTIQEWEIVWEYDRDKTLPEANFDNEGKWENLVSGMQDIVYVFDYVLDIFTNYFKPQKVRGLVE